MPTYSEQLKDPRWISRRKEIYARAGMRCQKCAKSGCQLHAHHLYYERGKAPWDYPDSALQCLCADCHEAATQEERLRATTDNQEIKRAISDKQAIQQIITGLAVKVAMPRKPRKLKPYEVWEVIKKLGDDKSRPMMACMTRLYAEGIPDEVILNIANHYAIHHATIQNPYAYYSKRGDATTARAVEVNDAEHARIRQEEARFVGDNRGVPNGTHATEVNERQ